MGYTAIEKGVSVYQYSIYSVYMSLIKYVILFLTNNTQIRLDLNSPI